MNTNTHTPTPIGPDDRLAIGEYFWVRINRPYQGFHQCNILLVKVLGIYFDEDNGDERYRLRAARDGAQPFFIPVDGVVAATVWDGQHAA